jgi:ATP-dependent protease Clp ATPase subunit
MENQNAIVYIYKRKKLDEDNDYITYTYEFVGISVGNETENEENYKYFFKPNEHDEKQILTANFPHISDQTSLEYEYVYAFQCYLNESNDNINELIKKTECDATEIKKYVLCQIISKGAEAITTHYINPDEPDTLADIDTNGIDGLISMLSCKHEKVQEIQEKLKEKYEVTLENISSSLTEETALEIKKDTPIIYADDIYSFTSKSVICQDDQIRSIAASIAKNQRIQNPRLKDNLLICGPTGVGKSEIFRCISKNLGIPITFEDSTEYTAAGYVGKTVTDALYNLYANADGDISKVERGIIIFDEIDKKISESGQSEIYAKAVIDSLLKMAEGHKYQLNVNKERIEIDTSFITFAMMGAFSGIEAPTQQITIGGFGAPNSKKVEIDHVYTDQTLIKYGLKPEFIGRNKLIIMNSLEIPDFCKIITESDQSVLLLYKYMLEELGIKMIYDSSCIEKIAKKAHELGVGVRSIKKIVENAFEVINYEVFSKGHYSELIITPETFDDNTKFILR